MANGDAALAAGMDVLAGTDDRRKGWDEINKTRDYIIEYGLPDVVPVDHGGTGATTPAGARAALGLVIATTIAVPEVAGKVPTYSASGTLSGQTPTSSAHLATKGYVDARKPSTADTWEFGSSIIVQGNIYAAGATPATSGYAVAYINGDGRLSKNASSERYKKYISEIDPATLGDIWPSLVRYQMRHGDGAWKYGYIAERLDENEDQKPFVVYQTETLQDEETGERTTQLAVDENGNPIPDSIDFIALLMAQNAQLHQAVELLAQRLDALEARDE